MAYTSITQVQSALGKPLTTEQVEYFNNTLRDSIDGYIDSETQTTFGTTNVTTVYASGNGTSLLNIPTMHTVSVVMGEDNTPYPITEYTKYPRGGDEVLALRNVNGNWSEGVENYTVVGSLGYKNIPAEISAIATEIAINNLTGLSSATLGVKSERVGDWSATYQDKEITMSTRSIDTLRSYRRLSRSI